jgi:hypothetical protein
MAAALLNEVASAKSFFSLIASDGPMHDQVVKNFADALIWQVNNCLVMTLHDATLLIHALKESPYADADMKRITAAIDAKVMMHQSNKADPDPDKFPLPTSSEHEVLDPTISEHEVLDKPEVEKKGIEMDDGLFCIPPLMPEESKDGSRHPAIVHYLGCKIYTSWDETRFIATHVRNKRSKHSKLSLSWGRIRTKKEAWDACIDMIQSQANHKK